MSKDNVCEWRITLHDWTGTYYEGSCGYQFHDNGFDANAINGKICPECKKPIRVIEEEKDGT
jgi:hypothetical protein